MKEWREKVAGKNMLLIFTVLALIFLPMAFFGGGQLSGADDEAVKAVSEINPGYQPWIKPALNPFGEEAQGLIFTLQAAVGSGFIGYYFGYRRGRSRR